MSPPTITTAVTSCAHSAPSAAAAKLFMQLAPPSSSRCARRPPVLDFLWPRAGGIARDTVTRRTFRSSSSGGGGSNSSRSTTRITQTASSSAAAAVAAAARRISSTATRRPASYYRGLTTVLAPLPPRTAVTAPTTTKRAAFLGYPSTRRWFTQAVFNPQKDDDGNEMKLEITPRAAKRLSEIMRKDANPHLALRIQVESGGCHGFQYLMSLVTLPDSLPSSSSSSSSSSSEAAPPSEHPGEGADSGAIREDDTIFTYTPEGEAGAGAGAGAEAAGVSAGAPKIILDQPSLELLKGSKVDFTMELIGSQFKIVDNPLATSSCGCGTSFDIKI